MQTVGWTGKGVFYWCWQLRHSV